MGFIYCTYRHKLPVVCTIDICKQNKSDIKAKQISTNKVVPTLKCNSVTHLNIFIV